MSVIKFARERLDMTQPEFGKWLADQTGRKKPYPQSVISDWETYRKSPRRGIRDVCAHYAALHALNAIEGWMTKESAAEIIVDSQY